MAWLPLILLLVQIFGPLLADRLKKRLDERLKQAAEGMPHPGEFGADGARSAVGMLFDRALNLTPVWRIGERMILKAARPIAVARAEHVFSAARVGATELPVTMAEVRDFESVAELLRAVKADDDLGNEPAIPAGSIEPEKILRVFPLPVLDAGASCPSMPTPAPFPVERPQG